MSMFTPEFIEKYQKIYDSDPQSKVFAPLAEAYRKSGELNRAFQICKKGCIQHPLFASGHVCMSRIFRDLKQYDKALLHLRKATELAPENIQAHSIMAEIYIDSRKPKEALHAFKQVLLLNPKDEKAQKSIKKLESLTADEFDSDTFQLGNLFEFETSPITFAEKEKAAERTATLVDAYLVRNEFEKAENTLIEAIKKYGNQKELAARMKLVEKQKNLLIEEDQKTLDPQYNPTHTPIPQSVQDLILLKKRKITRKKIEYLKALQRRVEDTKSTLFTF